MLHPYRDLLILARSCSELLGVIGVRAGGGGGLGVAATEIMQFFGQNALDSGNDTLHNTL